MNKDIKQENKTDTIYFSKNYHLLGPELAGRRKLTSSAQVGGNWVREWRRRKDLGLRRDDQWEMHKAGNGTGLPTENPELTWAPQAMKGG